jgi:hypothetical protein
MNLGDVKQPCVSDCKSSINRYRSDNGTYNHGDIMRIEIPTGKRGQWLHASDSFIEFKMTPTFNAGTSGSLSLNANALSLFKTIRILHGTQQIINVQNCNRLYQALYDIQIPGTRRAHHQITMGVQPESTQSPHGGLFGITMTSGYTYSFAFTIPISLIGSLQEKAVPLGYMGASSLYIEIELENAMRAFTGRTDGNLIGGLASTATTAPTASYVLSEIYYNAKISQLGDEYDRLLRNSLGQNITISAYDFRGEMKALPSGISSFSDKFSFNFSSCKYILFWLTNQSTANGVANPALNESITQRCSGPCKDYYLTLNGEFFPSQPISMALNGATSYASISGTVYQYGAQAYENLKRCFNMNSSLEGGVLDYALYNNSSVTVASDGVTSKRFIAGIDMDRVDGNNSRTMAGLNTLNQNVMLNVNWESALAEACNLYAYCCYDLAYVLQDGLLSVRQ